MVSKVRLDEGFLCDKTAALRDAIKGHLVGLWDDEAYCICDRLFCAPSVKFAADEQTFKKSDINVIYL
jgi:hypothetical protein